MKKGLLSIAAGLLISFGATAQNYDPTIWEVIDESTQVLALDGLVEANGLDGDMLFNSLATTYTSWGWETGGEVLKAEFTNPAGDNWSDFGFTVTQWKGGTGNNFTKATDGTAQDSDTAYGFCVDFTELANRDVTFKVQASAELNLRLDIGDIAGKLSNSSEATTKVTVSMTAGGVDITDDSKWQEVLFSWGGNPLADDSKEIIEDWYSGGWLNVADLTGLRDPEVKMDSARITKLAWVIDDGAQGTDGETKTLYIKDVQIGADANPTTYRKDQEGLDVATVDGGALEVVGGVVYSAGTITVTTVTGQVVASADGELNIAGLPAGAYVITAAEGTAKIVK